MIQNQKLLLGSMNNIPNMPHVKFQTIQTYGYDVNDVCLWRFFCFIQNWYNFHFIILHRLIGHIQFICNILINYWRIKIKRFWVTKSNVKVTNNLKIKITLLAITFVLFTIYRHETNAILFLYSRPFRSMPSVMTFC